MSENLYINHSLSKEEKYKALIPQLISLVEGEENMIANVANIVAALKFSFDYYFWVGVYFKIGNDLVLGPFQGPVACTRMTIPNGVCGQAADKKVTIIVPDVNAFPGHIACSTDSKSEIVSPVFTKRGKNGGNVIGVLDVDSDTLNSFDESDKLYLEQVCSILSQLTDKN
ncbi:MAG: GAF domain-containing protein [Ignavibacteriae bacterium]|nr:MAG: GAF domain-containing protein [Ignavibacteriota bacterium]